MISPKEAQLLLFLTGNGSDLDPQLISYTDMVEKSGLSNRMVSIYVREFQKTGLLQRDIDTRKYFLTNDGIIAAKISLKYDRLSSIIKFSNTRPLTQYSNEIEEILMTTGIITEKWQKLVSDD